MANVDRPSGLSPVQYLNGSPWNGQARMYCVLSTNGDIIAVGDPVASGGSADGNGVPSVALATAGAGNAVRGAVVAIAGTVFGSGLYDPANLELRVLPATKTKNYYVLVADDPNIVFEIQEVSGGTAFAATDVGLNAGLVAGTNNGYISGWEVNNVGAGTGATIQLKLLQLAPRRDNAFGEHAKWWVQINLHELKAGVAGVT